ncbi:hypothetical protein [Streptomyces filamentosus]|uniref:hypothetical protein n=1 Tax=Streptomyces filamentosus TaxID=67294 RepID=UPI00123C3E12|nr:hypothetical protein [Streptomyces filamentosus]KAA6211784.1 hypothetical protein CP979_36055 [Streptomyces filamentosus]KAA6219998.1 hypothetical protein CP979_26205 [Streptomyces filamentosus]KAA6220049.1 hypothetical protein CP979_26495 [Streptomyces filamentosus]
MAIELPDNLIKLEEAAWAEQQASALTVETEAAVQAAVTEHAQAIGESRFAVEAALKKKVRHPDA